MTIMCNLLGRAAIGALAIGLFSANAYAADAHGDAGPPPLPGGAVSAHHDEGNDIVVTGTRIKRHDLTSNSPLSTVSAQEIQYQGATSAEAVLNRMPQFTADANENVSNGSDGTSNVNLRNLGSGRVLVLMNGQRMLPTQAMDLNFVPSSLIERVDVVTGGASAVYGSDAISGVVNFILRDKLEGFASTHREDLPSITMATPLCADCRNSVVSPPRRSRSPMAPRRM
jgi:outer membrane receptor protein involved in Fe transport